MANFVQNGINFTISNNLQSGEKLHNIKGKLQSGMYPFGDYEGNDASKLINAVEIDWNGAQLSYVSLPNVLDNGNTINTTGQLLALINDLQEQINAIVYIMNNGNQGGGTVTPAPDDISTPAPTLPQIQFNTFPTDTSTIMPGVKIYTDKKYNTDQSKLRENQALYDNAKEWARNITSNEGSTNTTTAKPRIKIDALVIDDEIIDEYDDNYNYSISIYDDYIKLNPKNDDFFDILTIYYNGTTSKLSPTPTTTR